MADDRYNRDPRRNDYNVQNRRSSNYQNEDRGLDNPGSDWFRDADDRRDFDSNAYGSGRDDYRSRSSSSANSNYGSSRSYGGSGQGGGYDEYSRGGNRSYNDRYQTYDANRLDVGNYGRDRDQNRTYGGYDRSAYGGDRFRDSGSRDYGSRSDSDRWSGGQSYGGGERGYSQGGRGFWDKASDEVSSWFGDRDAERRRDQDEHRGRGPKNYSRSDDRIKEDINDRLTDDNYLDASDIDVAVKDREVTLSGTVSDRNAKRRAEDIAEGVSGVSNVQNNIRVKTNSGTGSSSTSTTTGSTQASGSSTTSVDVDRSNTLSGGLGGRMGSTGTSGAGSS